MEKKQEEKILENNIIDIIIGNTNIVIIMCSLAQIFVSAYLDSSFYDTFIFGAMVNMLMAIFIIVIQIEVVQKNRNSNDIVFLFVKIFVIMLTLMITVFTELNFYEQLKNKPIYYKTSVMINGHKK